MDDAWLRSELETLHAESFGWALSCCRRDRGRAAEALQRTYLKVLDRRARYGGAGAFKTWLFAVIRRTAQDERRREWLARLRLMRYADRAPPPRAASDEREASAAEFVAMLGHLSDRQRQVLQLVFYHDLTLTESAAVMGVSVGAARKHYDRGKRARCDNE